jgi:hypothetical protein
VAKRLEYRLDDRLRVEAGLLILLLGLVLVQEDVRQAHRAQLEAGVDQAGIAGEGEDMGAEAADRRLLDRHRDLVRREQPPDQLFVERLGEAQVGDRGRQAARVELVGGLQRLGEPGAERQDRDLLALAHDPALADLEPLRRLGQRDAGAVRRADSGPRSGGRRCNAAVWTMWTSSASSAAAITTKLGRVAEIGDVEAAGMGGAVGADQPGAVHREAHRQILDRDVVHDLVVGALQEGRIDRAERLHALGREAGGEGHRMLLGDADVEGALGEAWRRTCRGRCRTASPR